MEDTDYLLQLSTEEPKRSKIKIDDTEYELSVPEDFELDEFLQLSAAGSKAAMLMKIQGTNFDPAETGQLTDLLDKVVHSAVRGLPEEVFDQLKLIQKFAIVNVFSDAVGSKIGGAPLQPGQKSSPDFSDSTEEASEAG